MKDWQRLLIDPAAHTVLMQLGVSRTKEELVEKTGIGTERITKLLIQLLEEDMVRQEIDGGVRKFHLNLNFDRVKQLRLEVEDSTIVEIEDLVKRREYDEARTRIHRKPLVENIEKRRSLAKIEALEKLEKLPLNHHDENNAPERWQSLKGFIPRL